MSAAPFRRAARAVLAASLLCIAAPAAAAAPHECSPQASVDERAQCVLATPAGKRALAMVGETARGDLETKRAHAALTPSFARHVLRHADRAAATAALQGATSEAFQRHTGRTLAQWRAAWIAELGAAAAAG